MADVPAHVAAFQLAAQQPLAYTVVADPDGTAHRQIGAGDDPAMIVVDVQRIVRYLASWRDHRDHPGYHAVLQTVQDLNAVNYP